ncbi:MAG: hypothetical protein Q8M76_00825 [Spirochaetaceae bacterium]|nr:hypothetical protein [Spirochaetaceae bacterium]
MRETEKFRHDAEQAAKRAAGRGEKAADEALRAFFERSFPRLGEESASALFASYLERNRRSRVAAVEWLGAVASLLLMDYDGTELSREDWVELREALTLDAESLDMELLSYAMSLVVDNGAL